MQQNQSWSAVSAEWPLNKVSRIAVLDRPCEQGVPTATAHLFPIIPAWKRALDLLVLLVALPFLLVISAVFAIYIKIVSPGPVFFRQQRVGHYFNRFNLLKFRTMHVGADTGSHQNHLQDLINSDKPMAKLDQNDSRLIPLAKWIRASGLDELPQLFNVLMGEMSIVGPRPCTEYEFEQYQEWHKERCHALPGLTGLWQVSGKNKTTFTDMMKLDILYAREQSLGLDLRIMLKTFPVLCRQVSESKERRSSNVGPWTIGTATAALTSATITQVTSNTGGYEKRTQSRSSRMRILGT